MAPEAEQEEHPNMEKLSLVTSPELEDDLVDFLLEAASDLGFTSLPAFGHGTHAAMSIAEQVRGKRRRVLFQVVGDGAALDALVRQLGETLPGADVHYWIEPVRRAGRL